MNYCVKIVFVKYLDNTNESYESVPVCWTLFVRRDSWFSTISSEHSCFQFQVKLNKHKCSLFSCNMFLFEDDIPDALTVTILDTIDRFVYIQWEITDWYYVSTEYHIEQYIFHKNFENNLIVFWILLLGILFFRISSFD